MEKFLGVKLRKNVSYPEEKEFSELDYEEKPEISGFDPKGLENLTISDLKRMKDEREAKIFETPSEDADEAESEAKIFENPEEDFGEDESKTF